MRRDEHGRLGRDRSQAAADAPGARKSLRVVAGLAGISESHLCRLELGERALDRLSLIEALAGALQIAPSELTKLPRIRPE